MALRLKASVSCGRAAISITTHETSNLWRHGVVQLCRGVIFPKWGLKAPCSQPLHLATSRLSHSTDRAPGGCRVPHRQKIARQSLSSLTGGLEDGDNARVLQPSRSKSKSRQIQLLWLCWERRAVDSSCSLLQRELFCSTCPLYYPRKTARSTWIIGPFAARLVALLTALLWGSSHLARHSSTIPLDESKSNRSLAVAWERVSHAMYCMYCTVIKIR